MRLVIFTYERDLDIDHETLYVDYNFLMQHGINKTVGLINAFNPDLIIEREFNDGLAVYTEVYKYLKNYKKAWWCIDAHITLAEHINYAKQFDYIFLAQSWFGDLFRFEIKGKCFFLPLCHTQTLSEYTKLLEETPTRDIPLSFVGNIRTLHKERAEYIAQLKEKYQDSFLACTASYRDTLTILRRSQTTFNCSLNNDLNFRVWEALACQTLILTDEVTDFFKIKGLEQFLTTYEKLDFDPNLFAEPKLINGSSKFIKSAHTLTHRYQQLLEMITTGEQYEF